MLMTIQFPYDLWVAKLSKIHLVDLEPGFARSPLLVHRVEMPIDLCSIVDTLMPQEVESVQADGICFGNDVLGLIGKSFAEQCDDLRQLFGSENKTTDGLGRASFCSCV